MECRNCGEPMNNSDDRTGEIHDSGKYSCFLDSKGKPMPGSPVAEASTIERADETEDHSTHSHAEFNFGIVCLV